MKNVCDKWKKRKISLKAKVTVLNSLVYPIIYYAAHNTFCPDSIIAQVKLLAVDFLWNGNRPKIGMATIYQPVERGGLGLHNFELRLQAAQVAWARRFVMNINGDFWIDYLCTTCHVQEPIDLLATRQRIIFLEFLPFTREC